MEGDARFARVPDVDLDQAGKCRSCRTSDPTRPLMQIKAGRHLWFRLMCGLRPLVDRSLQMKPVSAEQAVAMIPDGATVMVGGFMGVGTPERLLDELVRQRKSGLSLISNDAAI